MPDPNTLILYNVALSPPSNLRWLEIYGILDSPSVRHKANTMERLMDKALLDTQ
jgi:hypothetical protein